MALDAKQVLQKNIALVVCYVLAIVPVVLWFILVVGGVQGGKTNSYASVAATLRSKKKALADIERDIQKDPASVYTPDHKTVLAERNTEIDNQYNQMIKIVSAREKWFPQFNDTPKDKLPGTNPFQSALNAALDQLRKDYKEIVEDPSPNK